MAKVKTSKKATSVRRAAQSAPHATKKRADGQIPAGDVRLTANIRDDLHLRLKILAANRRTTVGELIEQWIESLPSGQ